MTTKGRATQKLVNPFSAMSSVPTPTPDSDTRKDDRNVKIAMA
jgi:hypothetical protein